MLRSKLNHVRMLQSRACDISSVFEGVFSFFFQYHKEDFLQLKSPSGEESGRYTVTQTRRIITNSKVQVSSTTNDEKIFDFRINFYIYQIRALLTPLRRNKTNTSYRYR